MNTSSTQPLLEVSEDGREVAVALGAAPAGRLEFASGAVHLTLRADAALDRMVRAGFAGSPPRASLEAETLSLRYPRIGLKVDWKKRSADVTLNASVPWEIDIRGGAVGIDADLRWVELLGFRIGGGASDVKISLPPPSGAVGVHIGGGASKVRLLRPAETAARLQIKGGASKLAFDGDALGAVGGPIRLQSEGFEEQPDRYEIMVGGGASNLTVEN